MTTTGPLRVPLVVVPVTGPARDAVVDIDPACTTAGLSRALVPGTAPGASAPLFHARSGTWLRPHQDVTSIGLRAGDALVEGESHGTAHAMAACHDVEPTRVAPSARHLLGRRPSAAALLEIAVVGGPGTGRRAEIGAGRHVVGRGPGAAMTLPDAGLLLTHLWLDVNDGGAAAVTPAPDAAVFIDDVCIDSPTSIDGREVIRIGAHQLAVRRLPEPLESPRDPRTPDDTGRLAFNRPPRPRAYTPPEPIRVPAPPETPPRRHLGWGVSLAPALIGLAAWVLTGSTMLLVFMALSPVIGVWTFVEDGRRGHRRFRSERQAFLARLDAAAARLAAARAVELHARRGAHPDLVVLAERARNSRPGLWDRRPADADFLELRIGTAASVARSEATLADHGDPELRMLAADRLGPVTLPAVPIAVRLNTEGPVALSGATADVAATARALLLQVATRHSPRDVAVLAIVGTESPDAWRWLDWLPHGGVEGLPEMLASGQAAGEARVRALLDLVDVRTREALGFATDHPTDGPSVVVLLDGRAVTDRSEAARLLTDGPAARVFTIWLAPHADDVPGECRTSIVLGRDAGALHASWSSVDGPETTSCLADEASTALARQVATTLAGIRDITASRSSGALPRSVALPAALLLNDRMAEAIVARWTEPGPGLQATIGIGAGGPVQIDLRLDGPHALVAGTTGSGKSELLRTLIASLAATHSPRRINFLLVDYKGGAAFRECVELPHSVGLVTDLDRESARRVLTSLDAEVKRRELLLHDAREKDLVDLERRSPERAPASLVIVVDEFAALVRDVPEFVDGVVDIAQRGRSLGIHLVLATQRPNGIVSEHVRANANLRIALRVHEADDSRDVIGTADAATIPRSLPGRAFLRTGPRELVEVQCAYAGGPVVPKRTITGPTVHEFPLAVDEAQAVDPVSGPTDLTRLVGAVQAAATAVEAQPACAPWLPPLPACIPLADIAPDRGADRDRARSVTIGQLDDPRRQRQIPFVVDFESSGALAIVGAGGSGKTTALLTLAAAVAALDTTDALVFAIDAAGHGLDPLDALPHCGAVIPVADTDRVTALLGYLHDQLETRAAAIAEAGVGTVGELRGRDATVQLPRLFVLIDDYASFAAVYERLDLGDWVSTLHRVVSAGRTVGIHIVITADRLHALPASLTAAMPLRLLLRSTDPDDSPAHRAFGARSAGLPAGRALLTDGREVQLAVAGSDHTAEGQRVAVTALGNAARGRGCMQASGVPTLDTAIPLESLPAPARRLTAVIALADRSFEPRSVDLTHDPFLVVGPRGSGRTHALAAIASSLRRGDPGFEAVAVRPRDGVAAALAVLDEVLAWLDSSSSAGCGPMVVLLDDGELAVDGPIAERVERILAVGATRAVRLVAAIDPAGAARAFGGWVGELRRSRRALLLAPDLEVDGDLVGVRLRARPGQRFPPGRGFLVNAGAVELVQVAMAEVDP
ncbi:MAG: cell division protein FtsK/SpoIIIE [Actinomycetia bacterium]|nr:cell division protein FtsK/SpoIIIE [Actinomycetes bacterium]